MLFSQAKEVSQTQQASEGQRLFLWPPRRGRGLVSRCSQKRREEAEGPAEFWP